MADGISITSESLASNLSSFQAEMGKMDTLLSEIETATSNAKSSWEGNVSDMVMGQIEAFQAVFSEIKAQNEKYEQFINSVIDNYTESDNNSISSVESNINSYSINN